MTWTRSRAFQFAERWNLPLAGIVLIGFALTAYFTLRVTQWMIMTDELQHVKLAVSIADTLNPLPRVRGAPINAYAQLYPLLTAPAYGLFDMPTAFKVVKGINTLLMASTAIPAYLLCRDALGSRRMAWLVGALTVAVPWMAMASLMMTEVAAYPAFVWAVYLIYRSTITPSVRNDVLALVGIVIAVLARTQFIFLAPVLPAIVLAHELGFAAVRRERIGAAMRRVVREHRVLTAATALGLVAFVALEITGRLGSILGSYGGTISGPLFPRGTASFAEQLWASIGIGVGVIPLVAAVGWAVPTLVRPTDRRSHAYAVLFVIVSAVLSWQVASFLVRFSGSVQDRYFFYVVPLLFVGMAACLRDVRARPIGILVASGVFVWLTTLIDLTPAAPLPFWASPPVVLNRTFSFRSHQIGDALGITNLEPGPVIRVVTVVLGLALAFALWKLPRRRVLVVVSALVLVFCVGATGYTDHRFKQNMSVEPLNHQNDWVDQRLPSGAHAALVPGGVNATWANSPISIDLWTDWNIWWHVEFWNKSATRALKFEQDPVGQNAPFLQEPITANRQTGALMGRIDTPYLVVSHSNVRERIVGQSLGVNHASGLELLRAATPHRVDWVTDGLPFDGSTPPGHAVRIRVFAPAGGAPRRRMLTVVANQGDQSVKPVTMTLATRGNRARVVVPAKGAGRAATVPVCVKAPYTDIVLQVPTVINGAPGAVHVANITAGPPGRACRPGATLSHR